MTPVLWWNYPVWVLTAILTGLIVATYVVPLQRYVPGCLLTYGRGLLAMAPPSPGVEGAVISS
jgi:hypothetical protein